MATALLNETTDTRVGFLKLAARQWPAEENFRFVKRGFVTLRLTA
jgi:hypothetical protein